MINDDYSDIFKKIYDPNFMSKDTTEMNDSEKRELFESTRRYLDICRVINRKWPLTNKLITAKEGADLVLEVFSSLHLKVVTYPTVHVGAVKEYRKCVETFKGGKYLALLKLETELPSSEAVIEAVNNRKPDEILSLLMTLTYYYRASAPESLYKGILMND